MEISISKDSAIKLRVHKNTKDEFMKLCKSKGVKMSKLIEGFILSQIANNNNN